MTNAETDRAADLNAPKTGMTRPPAAELCGRLSDSASLRDSRGLAALLDLAEFTDTPLESAEDEVLLDLICESERTGAVDQAQSLRLFVLEERDLGVIAKLELFRRCFEEAGLANATLHSTLGLLLRHGRIRVKEDI